MLTELKKMRTDYKLKTKKICYYSPTGYYYEAGSKSNLVLFMNTNQDYTNQNLNDLPESLNNNHVGTIPT